MIRSRMPELGVGVVIVLLLGLVNALPSRGVPAPTLISTGANPTDTPVSADGLPTAQIDGVAWSQVVAGNTVFVGGEFQTARPAGSAPGQNEVSRKNLMSYDITTGALTDWAPKLNAQARVLALSPDGQTLYVGGDFTVAAQKKRMRVAAFDVATGAIKATFTPQLNAAVKTIVATDTTVFIGGSFTTANGQSRTRLAAFTAKTGVLLDWNPTANATVSSMVLTPNRTRLVVGGSFTQLGGGDAYGMGRISVSTGAPDTWAANQWVRNAGLNGSITSLTTDGTKIYGTGFAYSNTKATFEGVFAADPNSGNLNWIQDCHGDSYSSFPQNGVIYVASHSHDCERLGGFPQTVGAQRATAFTADAGTVLTPNLAKGYVSYQGAGAPSMLNWFPLLAEGDYTGQHQAAWSVTGNSNYVVMAGEFPSVNNTPQQGLVRFATRDLAPNKRGPEKSGDAWKPNAVSVQGGVARVGFQMNWDRDDRTLNYQLLRRLIEDANPNTAETLVWAGALTSTFYDRKFVQFGDSGLAAGAKYEYRLKATDPAGNVAVSARSRVTISGATNASAYLETVRGLGASYYYRFGETTGSTEALDWWGGSDGLVGSDVQFGVPGAVDGGTAYGFTGTNDSEVLFPTGQYGPQSFSVQAFVQTTSKTNQQIIGFGDSNKTLELKPVSYINDRVLYMNPAGQVIFGIYDPYTATAKSVTSPAAINDGQWHQVTGTFANGTMTLYVDGVAVAGRADVTSAATQYGWWRIGGDSVKLFNGLDKSVNFKGNIDDVAVYPSALPANWIAQLYAFK